MNFLIDSPNSISTEYFRSLRSIIFRKLSAKKTKTILLSSAQPNDGKSFISYNLAISIALVGKKTLIIDGDLKRPSLHKKFNVENISGVTDFILEKVALRDIILDTGIPNLSFIPAGPFLPNATEVIESDGLDGLFASVKNLFEYIVIDTSPIGLMTDAFLLTRYADHILIVVRQDATFKDSLTNVLSTFDSNDISNFDIVFNDVSIEEGSHHYSKYYTKTKK
jgi:capsular exopolysaccharide synthesis family protein